MKHVVHILWLLLVLPGCWQKDVIKIALVCPMSVEEYAQVSRGMKRACELAVNEANTEHRFPGTKIELAVFDDQADPNETVNISHQVVSDDSIIAVVGHLAGDCTVMASQLYARNNLLMINPCSTGKKLTKQRLTNVVRICPGYDDQASRAAEFVFNKLTVRKISVVHDKTGYGREMAESFVDRYTATAGTAGVVVSLTGIDISNKDFGQVIRKIKRSKPKFVYFGGKYVNCVSAIIEMRKIGLTVPVMTCDASFTADFLQVDKGRVAEGNYVIVPGLSPAELTPKTVRFTNKYKTSFPGEEIQKYDLFAYEAVSMILDAYDKTGCDKTKLAKHIKSVTHNGVLGKITVNDDGDTAANPVSVYVVRRSRFVYCD
jgi:branched-chain amino acid transport system substrate-binding protein